MQSTKQAKRLKTNNKVGAQDVAMAQTVGDVKKETLRPLFDVFLFIAFLASLAIYFNQDALLGDKSVSETPLVDVSVDDLLLNKTGLIDDNVDRFLNQVAPGYTQESIFDEQTRDYVDKSYDEIVSVHLQQVKNIHIYELIDEEKRHEKISSVLIEANLLFEQDKLTTPKFENAFSKYQYVLALDSNNAPALQGINNIINRYVFFIDSVIEKQEIHKVSILLESIRSVGEGYVDISIYFDKYKRYLKDDDPVLYASVKEIDIKEDHNRQPKYSPEHYNSEKIAKADYQITAVSMDLMKKNQSKTALKIISDFVNLYQGKSHAYDLLLQLHLNNGNTKAAEDIIYQNVQFESVYLAEKTARVIIARHDYQSALTLLESHKPDFNSNPDYYYLLAGLYIKVHSYKKAHKIYERLVTSNRYNAYYWFGLAVALEAQGDEAAITSYSVAKKIAVKGSLIDQYYQYDYVG